MIRNEMVSTRSKDIYLLFYEKRIVSKRNNSTPLHSPQLVFYLRDRRLLNIPNPPSSYHNQLRRRYTENKETLVLETPFLVASFRLGLARIRLFFFFFNLYFCSIETRDYLLDNGSGDESSAALFPGHYCVHQDRKKHAALLTKLLRAIVCGMAE